MQTRTIEQQYDRISRPTGFHPRPNVNENTERGFNALQAYHRNEGKERVKYWSSNERNARVYLEIIEEFIAKGEKLLRETCKGGDVDKLTHDKARACFRLAEELNEIYNSWDNARHPKVKVTWQNSHLYRFEAPTEEPTESALENARSSAVRSIAKIRDKSEYQCLFETRDDLASKLNHLIESLIRCFSPNFECTLFKSGPSTTEKMLNSTCMQAENVVEEQFTRSLRTAIK